MGLNILSIHGNQDTGGQGWRMTDAFRRLAPSWTFHSIVNPQAFTYIAYPTDLPWKAAKEAWDAADVVHLHNDFRTAKMLERKRGEKPAVVHFHGTLYRTDPYSRLREMRKRGAIGIVSTLDLLLIAPDDTLWLPSPYDLAWLASLRPCKS